MCKLTSDWRGCYRLSSRGYASALLRRLDTRPNMRWSPGYTEASKQMYAHFNVQNIRLNNLLVYIRFNSENVRRYFSTLNRTASIITVKLMCVHMYVCLFACVRLRVDLRVTYVCVCLCTYAFVCMHAWSLNYVHIMLPNSLCLSYVYMYITVQTRILVKPRIYEPNLGFAKQCW
jgi:hypothetical protein